ncbi:LOW QUALITY PROTEIN: uncharacterized protein LOC123511299 [Portunus trituberculatus]|uniref:LOW QUALITY PROTEIN: uncharacterized protein LOC123511299 n=1 Tax=Portunus trituberculatus TaxID=210409 RepID=UPI001E1CB808|nr:LOW QUALITY PROTEIN: uncharacterized protein LOC123511299 [Portunus trituberculatus]
MNTRGPNIHVVVLIVVIARSITTATTTTTTTATTTTTNGRVVRLEDIFPTSAPSPPILLCSEEGTGEACFIPAPRPMDWRSAHHFCRSEGGFLLGPDELTLPEVIQLTPGNLTWTALRSHQGRLQWFTRRPAIGQFLRWIEGKEEGREECASLHLPSTLLHPSPCSSLLPTLCLRPGNVEEIQTNGGVELRVEVDGGGAAVEAREGWVRVREEEFHLISLTCTAHLTPDDDPTSQQPQVFWSKDDVYLPLHSPTLLPATVHDPTKSHVSSANTSQLLLQGTYWCEAWRPRSPARRVSNKVLLTLEGHEVLLLHFKERRPWRDPPPTMITVEGRVRRALNASLPHFEDFPIDVVSIVEEDDVAVVSARVQVHLPSSSTAFSSVLAMLRGGREFENLLERAGLLIPAAAFPTRCRRWTEEPFGIEWPFSEVGKVQPLHYRCEATRGRLLAGRCHWNYTHGATIRFDPRECQRFDFCPRGYTGLAGTFCVSLTAASTWDEGFLAAYTSRHAMSVLDVARLHQAEVGMPSLYQKVRQWLSRQGGDIRLWLPAQRQAPFGPMAFLGPGASEYPIARHSGSSRFNVSWAAGQPSPKHNCLALDTNSSLLLSLPCSTALSFLTIIDMSGLFAVPSQDWQRATPNLFINNSLCDGWQTSGTLEAGGLASRYSAESRVSDGMRPGELCAERDAHLPDPSDGFLDWPLRQYLYTHNITSVWIRLTETKTRRVSFLNWRADVDPSLDHEMLTPSGWVREGDDATKTVILCQKSVKAPEVTLQLFEELGAVRVEVQPADAPIVGDPRCHVNGREASLVYKRYRNQDTVMAVDRDTQGYYKCSVWVDSPFRLVESNVLLYTHSNILSLSVTIARLIQYRPALHDSTFYVKSQLLNDPCVADFLEQLREGLAHAPVHVTADNFYLSPKAQSNDLLLHFHVQFETSGGHLQLTEDEMRGRVTAALKHLSHKSCRGVGVRSTTGCYRETQLEQGPTNATLTWPATQGATVVLPAELCVTEDGDPVTRECVGDFISGYRWSDRSGECTDHPLNVTRKLWEINQDAQPSDAADLAVLTNHGDSLTSADVHFVAQKMHSLSRTSFVERGDLDHIVETLNNVMEADESVFGEVQRVLNTSSILVESLENISLSVKLPLRLGDQPLRSDKRLVSVERLDLVAESPIIGYQAYAKDEKEEEGMLWNEEEEEVVRKGSENIWKRSKVAIILPSNLTRQVAEETAQERRSMGNDKRGDKVQLMFAVYRNSKLFQDNSSFPNHTVSGHIIQATYGGGSLTNLTHNVSIYFKVRGAESDSKCVFWNFGMNEGRGGWSTEGCWSGGRHGDHWLCKCSHLTCFAHLVNFDENMGVHESILTVISTIGCVLSIVSLLLVLMTFLVFQKWRRRLSNKILANLALAILCSLTVFLTGVEQTLYPLLCRGVAVALHYFILASFGWMLVEAVHQYLKFVKVVGTYIPRFIWKASVCAWGVPFVPIIAVLVYDSALYDSDREDKICWMSSTAFKYAFVPPLAATMAVNLVLFVLIIHAVTCGRVRVTSTLSERQLRLTQLRMAISVFFLLGFTWVFGLLSTWRPSVVLSYLFCISNTLQGFFIFLFHVFRERDARRLWRDFLSVISKGSTASEAAPSLPTPRYSGQPSPALDNSNSVSYNQQGEVCFNPRGPAWDKARGSVRSTFTVSTLAHSRASTPSVD